MQSSSYCKWKDNNSTKTPTLLFLSCFVLLYCVRPHQICNVSKFCCSDWTEMFQRETLISFFFFLASLISSLPTGPLTPTVQTHSLLVTTLGRGSNREEGGKQH